MGHKKTLILVHSALFAALSAVLSQIVIPLWPVPVNLATLSVYLAGALLGPVYGPVSQLVYALLGAIGLPVFSMLRGGPGVLTGPTGGYIIGYIISALVIGLIVSGKQKSTRIVLVALLLGTVVCYIFGTVWFMLSTTTSLARALMICVVPFLPGDALKITAVLPLIKRLKPVL